MPLIEMANGDWINTNTVSAIRVLSAEIGPRVVIDTPGQFGHHMLRFDDDTSAKEWAREFGNRVVSAELQAKFSVKPAVS